MKIVTINDIIANRFAHRSVTPLVEGNLSLGPETMRFEERLSKMTGMHTLSVNSGTAAVHLGCLALQKRYECKSITVPIMTVPMVHRAAIEVFGQENVVFEDVSPYDFSLENNVFNTDAVLIVTTGGIPSNRILPLAESIRKQGKVILEDASHSHGCFMATQIGDIVAQSWFATKVLTMGEGGVVYSRDEAAHLYMQTYANQGKPRGQGKAIFPGRNYRASELSCILGNIELDRRYETFEARQALAEYYSNNYVKHIIEKTFHKPEDWLSKSSFYKYPVLMQNPDQVATELRKAGFQVPSKIHDYAMENEVEDYTPYSKPTARFLSSHHLCLPMSREWTKSQADRVIGIVRRNAILDIGKFE